MSCVELDHGIAPTNDPCGDDACVHTPQIEALADIGVDEAVGIDAEPLG